MMWNDHYVFQKDIQVSQAQSDQVWQQTFSEQKNFQSGPNKGEIST